MPVTGQKWPPWSKNSRLKRQHSVDYWMMCSLLYDGDGREVVRVSDSEMVEAFFVSFFSSPSFNTHGHNMTDLKTQIDHQLQGWPEFVKYYSLGFGHFLVFRYEGNSRFHACIFDTTTVEIEYPLIRAHSDGPKRKEIKDDDSVEVLEDLSPHPRKRKSSPLPCSQPHKKFRTSPICETDIKGTRNNERILKNSMRNGDLHHSKSMRGMRKFLLSSFKKLIFWYLNKLLFPCRVVFLYCLFSFILFPVSAEDGNGDKSIMPRWRLSEVQSFTYKVVIKPSHVGKYFDMVRLISYKGFF
ncbi:B3 domain-containing protein [Morus notabilis]|uniref:B3 domain-containing protein n=1 Tax=Morus notabilis TaxID=981085 RepID=W9R934_9ROSA|nr:B3 domain-containing protein [Morus notabilis]